jgi:glucokinase
VNLPREHPESRATTVLAGDIGGSNSRLAISENGAHGLAQVFHTTSPSHEFNSVEEILCTFLAACGTDCGAACLGPPGPALPRIYSYLAPAQPPRLDAPSIVERAGLDPACEKTVATFSRYVGAAAGNIALTMMATGGVFFCGGVAPKIVDAIGGGAILEALFDKGRMRPLLERIPIYPVRDDDLALRGAAQTALRRVTGTWEMLEGDMQSVNVGASGYCGLDCNRRSTDRIQSAGCERS